jgi:hypothetical protein
VTLLEPVEPLECFEDTRRLRALEWDAAAAGNAHTLRTLLEARLAPLPTGERPAPWHAVLEERYARTGRFTE